MASYSVVSAAHNKTLSGTTADLVTLTGKPVLSGRRVYVMVTNWDATNKLYVRLDGTTAVGSADATSGIGPGEWRRFPYSDLGTVSVVGNGNTYSVEVEADYP